MPRHNDYPLLEIEEALKQLRDTIDFHQKWTCRHCMARQTMAIPNILYTSGICEECGQESKITHCNYLLIGKGADMVSPLKGGVQPKDTKH